MTGNKYFSIFLSILLLALCGQASAQMVQRNEPRVIGWADDNHFLLQTVGADKKAVTTRVHARTGKKAEATTPKSPRELLAESIPDGYTLGRFDVISPDASSVVISKDNDLFFFALGKPGVVRLTNTSAAEINPRYSPDGKRLAFTLDRDLYCIDLTSLKETRLTFDATDKVYNGWASWVYMEEILGRRSNYAAFWWSPDGTKLAYLRFDDSDVPDFTLNRLDVEDGIHGKLEVTPYPKPGDPNPKVKMGIVDVTTAQTVWVKTDYSIDQYLAWPFWTPNSKSLAIQVLNRDQNDMRFILADVASGEFSQIYSEARPTWVDFFEDVYVMSNGKGFILRSYQNDWHNLYHYGWDGKLITQITNVNWKVTGIDRVDERAGILYFTGTGPEPTESHFFKVGLNGSGLTQITSGQGSHSVSISPKGNYFVDSWSSITSAGAIVSIDAKGKQLQEVHRFEQPTFDASKHARSELVKINTSDGLFSMPAIITYPVSFNSSNKYPVVFTIYGGPDAGSVRNSWAGVTPSWYAENGIITISVDHRGSGKFGKKGLDYLHRNLGKWELLDYADAVKWLREKPFVDAERMGITGGSYGGYITSLALTKGAEYWTHGIANYSVTDWKLYDNVYTERFNDTPADNSQGYNDGSVLNFIDNFKGKILITHGDMDDNVHMQNSIQFISKLQDANKTFEFMIYPNGRHGWGGAKRTHFANLTRSFWLKHFFGK